MEKKVIIDGFEFAGQRSGASDIENLNSYLEKVFNKFDIKDYMSKLHPEIFPKHIGLKSDDSLNLRIVRWERSGVDACGEYYDDWRCSEVENPEKYRGDILAFYKKVDPALFEFIKDKIK